MGTIRELTSHRVNGLNEALRIFVLDEPGAGNACHDYVVLVPWPEPKKHPNMEEGEEENYKDWYLTKKRLSDPDPDCNGAEGYWLEDKDHSLHICNSGEVASIQCETDRFRINLFHVQRIHFQNGPVKEKGYNGNSHEALLAILLDRMESFQAGPYACHDNQMALDHLQGARLWLHKRTMDRVARQVEGTHQK